MDPGDKIQLLLLVTTGENCWIVLLADCGFKLDTQRAAVCAAQ